ncbi:rhodanese-like domain-containing protein [Tumebacillus sp. ITR2]|uniref:Rhodanese-like domain-containing protein n=1 Tax=Tumebacillus amylolyticus TaxID=2801339 RepID=A0ABS1JD27_9BACL|nr:rhodanese-like domain-containing protein [Tumebacillus amylolyticus]MBL0388180.1 rhodanese-like domain-containing protein [Tumebacillus amylolyticus]
MLQDAKVVIDIRDEAEFLEGHIPGAVHCPLQELTYAVSDADFEDLIVVVCRTGKRAQQVKALLEHEGYHKIEVLPGGMTAYQGEIVKGE